MNRSVSFMLNPVKSHESEILICQVPIFLFPEPIMPTSKKVDFLSRRKYNEKQKKLRPKTFF